MANENSHSVVDLCDFLLVQGVLHEVSDVHFDPYGAAVVVRFRLDGVLRDIVRLDSRIKARLTARLKVVSRLATFKKAVAQEGRAALKIGERTVDFRFSSLPTIHGEKVAVRVFDPAKSIFQIGDLGMSPQMLADFEGLLMRPQGTVLLTGPAGSGKTTTMYAALNFLRENRKNLSSIATVEDPVEYDLQVVNQTQVNSASGLTFANALRTVLRQDPEVIMIGEVRDRETADIAVQAGLTGHMILSTVHARSAAGVPLRLVDLGVEPYLLTSSLTAVVSQRLVRKVCKACVGEHVATSEEVEKLAITIDDKFYAGKGCDKCAGTGYSGRVGIFQLVPVSQAMQELIMRRCSVTEIEAQIERDGVTSLLCDGLSKAKGGITTLEELLRVIG
jgi:type II secretory ATPase GspE/PulE/Tfp pilus assembly ATPase PilB-like protein